MVHPKWRLSADVKHKAKLLMTCMCYTTQTYKRRLVYYEENVRRLASWLDGKQVDPRNRFEPEWAGKNRLREA